MTSGGPVWKAGTGLIRSLALLAEVRPGEPLYTFVDAKGEVVAEWDAVETRRRALGLGRALLDRHGLRPGDRVLLVYEPGLDFVAALLACLHAGLVAVPTALPEPDGQGLRVIALDCAPKAVLTTRTTLASSGVARARRALEDVEPSWAWIPTDDLESDEAAEFPEPASDALALIQYTSGSTRSPRGVCLSLRNLQHQLEAQRRALACTPDCRYVFWLPHYHDFGLISAVFGAAHGNGRAILFAPASFLRRAALWGDLMTRYRATHTAAPDFGYRLLIQRTTPAERASWDLRDLRVMACAAEPVRPSTADALWAALAPCGLDAATFAPSYGLAEYTVGVSMCGRVRVRLSRDALEGGAVLIVSDELDAPVLLGCGPPAWGVDVRMVDPITCREVPPGHVGEIWVDGPSKASGYWGRAEETAATFEAALEGHSGRWLRTGDLGAFVDGEIVVTGRLKDLVILGGRNVYPQDVEELVAAHPLVRPGRVVCFGVAPDDAQETVVVVAELSVDMPSAEQVAEFVRTVRGELHSRLRVGHGVLVLAKRDAIPRTTSGKLRRRACRDAFLEHRIECHAIDRGIGGSNPGGTP